MEKQYWLLVAAKALVEQTKNNGGKAIAVAGDVSVEADVLHLFVTADKDLRLLLSNKQWMSPENTSSYQATEFF